MDSVKCLEKFAKMFPDGSLARSILDWQIRKVAEGEGDKR